MLPIAQRLTTQKYEDLADVIKQLRDNNEEE